MQGALIGGAEFAVTLMVTFFLLFFFLRDKSRILAMVEGLMPLAPAESARGRPPAAGHDRRRRLRHAGRRAGAGLGGLFAFGATGIVLGPLIFALGFALLEVWKRRMALHEIVAGVNDASPWERPAP